MNITPNKKSTYYFKNTNLKSHYAYNTGKVGKLMGDKASNNEIQQKTTLSLEVLDQKELQAVELKYLGKTSSEIAKSTGYNENYVRNLFMSDGRLEKAYKDFALRQQNEAQKSVVMALNRAREEALQAIERIIALSKDADNEAAIFKANEFLLNVAGIKSEVSLRSFFQNKTYEQARKLVDELFSDLFGQNATHLRFQVAIYRYCPKCDPKPESPNPTIENNGDEQEGIWN